MIQCRLDLLYKWSSGKGFILTPRRKMRWGESYKADIRGAQNENYLLVTLIYTIDDRGRVSSTGYSLSSNIGNRKVVDEVKNIVSTYWLHYKDSPEPPSSLNFRIIGVLKQFAGLRELVFSEDSSD